MNKAVWIAGGIVLAAALFGAYTFISHQKDGSAPERSDTGSGNAAVGANGASSLISYTDTGFSASSLTVSVGTTVTWTNESSRALWIQSDASADSDCPSAGTQGALDECKSVTAGGSYSFTFTEPGTVTYRNREYDHDTGSITVMPASAAGTINPNAVPE